MRKILTNFILTRATTRHTERYSKVTTRYCRLKATLKVEDEESAFFL